MYMANLPPLLKTKLAIPRYGTRWNGDVIKK
jgi:hypothetical protein